MNFECVTMYRMLFAHEIASLCMSACSQILSKLQIMMIDAGYHDVSDINKIKVIMQLQLNCLSKLTLPLTNNHNLINLEIIELDSKCEITTDTDEGDIYCLSELCVRKDDICSCFYTRVMEVYLTASFEKMRIHVIYPHEKMLVDQGFLKCISSVQDLGTKLNNCVDNIQHQYKIVKLINKFRFSDNTEHQFNIYS